MREKNLLLEIEKCTSHKTATINLKPNDKFAKYLREVLECEKRK